MLQEFNSTCFELNIIHSYSLTDVLSPDADFWQSTAPINISTQHRIPWNMQRSIVQALLLVRRTSEELNLLKQEMECVLTYWRVRKEKIAVQVLRYGAIGDVLSQGAQALLRKLLWEAEIHHAKATVAFSPILICQDQSQVTHLHQDFESDSSDSDSDAYEDDDNDAYDDTNDDYDTL